MKTMDKCLKDSSAELQKLIQHIQGKSEVYISDLLQGEFGKFLKATYLCT